MDRSSGILLPIFSLPSPYGIGTLGREAYKFADFLHASGQKVWQMLPLGPTSFGDSPYQSFSTYAGNPYFIDLDMLIEDGLLTQSEVDAEDWGDKQRYIDYEKIYNARFKILCLACERGYERDGAEIEHFLSENSSWLPAYAEFMALKRHFGMRAWTEWNEDIRRRRPEALKKYSELLKDDIRLFIYIQFLFYRQWAKLKDYINSLDIRIIGDLPIYVALDSADVWSEPEFFKLDEDCLPTEVAGVPPDYFCEDGQLWGNPLYDWEKMRKDGFGWWIRRVDGAKKLYDVIRIDHFRGFEKYWAVPYGDETAKNGQWREGPGMELVGVLTSWFYGLDFIAEDLGVPSKGLRKLLEDSGLPGMRILEFAFDSLAESPYQMHNYTENCVCYTGTHDNAPIAEWYHEIPQEELEYAFEYMGISDSEGINRGMLRCGLGSVAKLFVAQLQDWLELGKGHRINTPGTIGGNWCWRLVPEDIRPELTDYILHMTKLYGRL